MDHVHLSKNTQGNFWIYMNSFMYVIATSIKLENIKNLVSMESIMFNPHNVQSRLDRLKVTFLNAKAD